MVVVAWIILILAILFLISSKFDGFVGLLYMMFLFVMIIFSGIVIWEVIHSISEFLDVFR